jgi:hypothetical protein
MCVCVLHNLLVTLRSGFITIIADYSRFIASGIVFCICTFLP